MIVLGTSVWLDVHALSVVAPGIDEETGKVTRARLCPDYGEVMGWVRAPKGRCPSVKSRQSAIWCGPARTPGLN